MNTPKNIEAVLKTLPEMVKAAITEKNRERAEEVWSKGKEMANETQQFFDSIVDDAGSCAHIILEMLQEPLKAAGIEFELPVARGFSKEDLEIYLQAEIHKATKIIPYVHKPLLDEE